MKNIAANISRASLQWSLVAGGGALAVANSMFHPWPLVAAAAMLASRLRKTRKPSDSFGSARWATVDDLLGANLFGSGIPLGYLDYPSRPSLLKATRRLFTSHDAEGAVRHFLMAVGGAKAVAKERIRLPDGVHTAVFAPPGMGKTTGFIIPALLDCPDSAFVIDLKGELYKATAGRRARMGHDIVCLDPFGILGAPSQGYNPLAHIDPLSADAPADVHDLANAMVFRTGKEHDPHWNDSAETALMGVISFVLAHTEKRHHTLTDVLEVIADASARAGVFAAMIKSDTWDGTLRRIGHQLSELKDREAASVFSSTLRHLSFLHSPPVARFLRGENGFDPASLANGRTTVYLVIPPDHLKAQAPFLRLVLAGVFRAMFRAGENKHRRVQFFIDEAAALGKLDSLDQALAVGRGYGVRLNFAYQSMGQLKTQYPDGADQTFLSCVGCQTFLGAPNDLPTAEYVQNLLGEETIFLFSRQRGSSVSHSTGTGAQDNYSTSTSVTTSEHGRKLMQAAETFNLDSRQAIVFLPGRTPPVLAYVPRYFEDPHVPRTAFARRMERLRPFLRSVTLLGCAVSLLALLCLMRFDTDPKATRLPQADHIPTVQTRTGGLP